MSENLPPSDAKPGDVWGAYILCPDGWWRLNGEYPLWQCPVCNRTYTGESSSACANGHTPAIWRPYQSLSHRGENGATAQRQEQNQSSDSPS